MPEDFSRVFTIELFHDDIWEVIWTCHTWRDASARFWAEVSDAKSIVRMTSPTDTSIYKTVPGILND